MVNPSLTCDRCGLPFNTGDPVWRVQVSLTADVIRGLAEYEGLTEEQMDKRMEALLSRINLIPKEMLEDQVYQEFSFLVCGKCRSILAANPLQQPLNSVD
jgi:hypothetical protein